MKRSNALCALAVSTASILILLGAALLGSRPCRQPAFGTVNARQLDILRSVRAGYPEEPTPRGVCENKLPCTGSGIVCEANLLEDGGDGLCKDTTNPCGNCSGLSNQACNRDGEPTTGCVETPERWCCNITGQCTSVEPDVCLCQVKVGLMVARNTRTVC